MTSRDSPLTDDNMETCAVDVGAAGRPRRASWTASEMEILVSEVSPHSSVLFSSFSGTLNMKEKRNQWEEVTEKINANSSTKRALDEIKKKWTDMKSQTRRRAALSKKESRKAEGGPAPVSDLNNLEQMVVSLIPNCQLEGCEGGLEREESVTLLSETAAMPLIDAETVPTCNHSEAREPVVADQEPITVSDDTKPAPRISISPPLMATSDSVTVSPKEKITVIEERKMRLFSSLLQT